jgi:hypothetical protein
MRIHLNPDPKHKKQVDPHWFQCGSGSSIFGHCGSGTRIFAIEFGSLQFPLNLKSDFLKVNEKCFLKEA